MKNNTKLGAILAIVGILSGLLFFYLIAAQYNPIIDAHVAAGRSDEGTSVSITFAFLGWIGITAGAIWAMVLYGFLRKEKWAWLWGTVAATIQLLAGFFPMIPAADADQPPSTMVIFVIAAVLWFGMLFIRGVKKNIILLAFVAGLAYVLTFIDGVAPISKFVSTKGIDSFWNGVYAVSQQVNWWGAAAWAVFIFALLNKKSWAIPIGIFAAAMSMIAGYPMGINNALFEVHRFSMFLPAPLISTALVIYLALPGTRKMIEAWNKSED
ncbi:MAG: hypothetical protein BGO78_02440 [Chloroflexi bacterium 44-23]|nr:MAG: hypothetical protein BGO78_02440 [Chloroflexi bacterium 44-23]